MATNDKSADVHFTAVDDIAALVKQRNADTLRQSLPHLKHQLEEAVKIRVDPTEKNARPLVEYIQSCTDPSDLLGLWEFQARNNIQDLECLAPDIVSLFMRLCSTPIIRPFGLTIASEITQQFIKPIQRGLASARVPTCISMFRLLTSLCALGQAAIKDLLKTFNFHTDGFLRAARYRKKTTIERRAKSYHYDLRTHFVRFVLGFFIHGNVGIKLQVLEVESLLNGIFSNIADDAYPLLKEIFSTLQKYFLHDGAIPRSVKQHHMSLQRLGYITKLYSRTVPEPLGDDETGVPAQLMHEFLISICTVPNAGICQRDNGWYTIKTNDEGDEQKQPNATLSKFIYTLHRTTDLRQQELVLRTLRACPALIHRYWQHDDLTMEPRLNSQWLASAAFLQKAIRLPVPSLLYGTTQLYPTHPPEANIIIDSILPKVFGRTVSSKGLSHTSPLVCYTTMTVLATAFQKYVQAHIALTDVVRTMEKTDEDAAQRWQTCVDALRETFRRRLPDMRTLYNVYTQIASATLSEGDEELTTQNQLLRDVGFRLIRYYQEHLPEALMESKIDPVSFIPKDIFSVRPESLVHLLELLLHLSDFKWTDKRGKDAMSPIATILLLYLQTPYELVRQLTRRVVQHALGGSLMFQHDLDEIQLWLDALPADNAAQETVIRFMDESLNRFARGQYRYADKQVAIIQTVHASTTTTTKSYPLLDMDDVLDTHGTGKNALPFSPVLLTMLEHLGAFKGDRSHVEAFLESVVTCLASQPTTYPYLRQACQDQHAALAQVISDRHPTAAARDTAAEHSAAATDAAAATVEQTTGDVEMTDATLDCDVLVRQVMDGNQRGVTMESVEASCKQASIDLAELLLEVLHETTALSAASADILQLGQDLAQDRTGYANAVMNKILVFLTTATDKDNASMLEVTDGFYDMWANYLPALAVDWSEVDSETLQDFVLVTLMDNMANPSAIHFTDVLIQQAYQGYEKREPIETYMRRVLENNRYSYLTSPSPEENADDTIETRQKQRAALLGLVQTLHTIQPKVLADNHGLLSPLMTSYGATTHPLDRQILELLRSVERVGRRSLLAKMVLFGPGSDRRRQALAQGAHALDPAAISVELLDLIDVDRMRRTLARFPLDATLSDLSMEGDVYDIGYFVPLFANLLAHGAVQVKAFIESHALGLLVVCLAAQDEQLRRLGYQCMDKFDGSLATFESFEAPLVRYMFEALKNSVPERLEGQAPPLVPAPVAYTVAYAMPILFQPEHPMYTHLTNWVIREASFELKFVPVFNQLFTSSSGSLHKERLWLLNVMASAMRTHDDYKAYSRIHAWEMIATFYFSPLADHECKKAVIEILMRAVATPVTALSLMRYHGLLSWIHQALTMAADAEEVQAWQLIQAKAMDGARTCAGGSFQEAMLNDEAAVLQNLHS